MQILRYIYESTSVLPQTTPCSKTETNVIKADKLNERKTKKRKNKHASLY